MHFVVSNIALLSRFYSPRGRGVEYCDERFCLCVFLCQRSYLWNDISNLRQFFVLVTYSCSLVLLWRCSDMLCISGFMDDVIFAHKLIGCSTSPPR